MDRIIKKLPLTKLPMRFKVFWAKVFIHMMSIENFQNDIVLHNELELWIKTNGRPTTSNPNYWINSN